MNSTKTEEGVRTTPEKNSILPSTTMESQEQNEEKATPPAAQSPTTLEDVSDPKLQIPPKATTPEAILPGIAPQSPTKKQDTGSSATSLEEEGDLENQASPKLSTSEALPGIVPQDPTTILSLENEPTSSGESSEYKDDLAMSTFSYGAAGTTRFSGLGPQAVIPWVVSKQETGFASKIFQHDRNDKLPNSPIASTSKFLPGTDIEPSVTASEPESKQEAGWPSTSLEHDGDVKLSTSPMFSTSKSLPDTTPPVAATQPDPKTETGLPSKILEPGGNGRLSTSAMVSTSKFLPGAHTEPSVTAPEPVSKEETALPSTSHEYDGDVKLPSSPILSNSKSLPGIASPVAATQPESEEKGSLSSTSTEHDGDVQLPTSARFSGSKSLLGLASPVAARQTESKEETSLPGTNLGQNAFPRFSGFPKGVHHDGGPEIKSSSKVMVSNIVPGINVQSTATAPDTGNFHFTMNTPVPQQPGQSSAAELFLFAQAGKKPFEKAEFRRVKRPVSKPYIFTQTKGPAEAPMIQVVQSTIANPAMSIPTKCPALMLQEKEVDEEPKFQLVKPSLAEAAVLTPQAKKPINEPVFIPLNISSAKPSTPRHQAKKPVDEPRLTPVRSPFAESSVSTRQARKSTDFPQFPAVQPSGETELKRSTTKDVRRQEGNAEADKKAQSMRELLAEKRELRSQRDALAREKTSLETRLQGQTDAIKKVEGREEEAKKEVRAKNKEVTDLKTENDRLKKALEAVSLPAPKPEQDKGFLPARTEASEKSTNNGDLQAERAKEIDDLKDEIKKWKEKERDLKTSTAKEAQSLKSKLRKAEEDIRQKKKDDDYYRKQADKDTKKIENLSGELTKLQIAKAKVDKELKALIVKSNKPKISEGESKSQEGSLDEVEKLRQSLKESGAETKSAKEQAGKFKKDLEAREGDITRAKTQIDKLAKDLEESDGRTITATALASARLEKIETLEASQIPPNQPKETSEEYKRKFCNLTADHQALREELEEAKRLASTTSMEIDGLKAAHEELKGWFGTLTVDFASLDRLYTKALDVTAASLVDLESLKTANEVLEVNFEQTKAANGQIEPLTDQNKALVKTCQGLEKKVAEQIDKLRESSASNEELSRKLQKSKEVEERTLQNLEEIKGIYKDVSPFQVKYDQQEKELEYVQAKLAKEAEARQKSASRANRQQQQIDMQVDSLREVRWEKAQLAKMVDDQAAELAKYKSLENGIQAEADLELVSAMLGKERTKIGEADARREASVKTTLEGLEEVERERRQRSIDELERKDAELYEAQREIRELGHKLLASNQATAAALAASSSSKPSQSSPSPPPKTSPDSSQSSSPTSTPPAAGPQSWFQVQRPRISIPKSFSPGRFLIFLFLFIFLRAFLVPDFKYKPPIRQTTEEIVTWRTADEVSRQEVMEMEEQFQRSRRVARAWAIWEQTDAEEAQRWP